MLLPMLAKRYRDDGHKIEFPCYAQPKLDGVRCLAKRVDGKIKFYSRKGNEYKTLGHIAKELDKIIGKDEVLDGEIYIHHKRFQELISAIKNVKNKGNTLIKNTELQFHIFDYANTVMPYVDRYNILKEKFKGKDFKSLVLVKTDTLKNRKQVVNKHKQYVKQGYEGLILRNAYGYYRFDYRSDDLQKYKTFVDEEFPILAVRSGVRSYDGCGTFICQTKDGLPFDVNPKGTLDQKREYLRNRKKYIGKMLIVKYQEKSKDNIPRFAVGIGIRDYE